MSGAAVYHQRGISTAVSKAKAYLAQPYINRNHNTKQKYCRTTRPCRPARYISRDQHSRSIYIWRSYISTAIKNLKRNRSGRRSHVDQGARPTAVSSEKHIWRRCMSPRRYICMSTAIRNLKRSRSGRHTRGSESAAVYRQRGTSTAISIDEAYLAQMYIKSHRSLKQSRFGRHSRVDQGGISSAISSKTNIWRRCMSPARFSCTSTGIKNLKRSHSGRHGRVKQYINRDQQSKNISGADVYQQHGVVLYQQQSKPESKALLENAAVSTRAVYQPRSAKQKHIWRSCISPAPYINHD